MAFASSLQRVTEVMNARIPFTQSEVVRVVFLAADTDTDVPHSLPASEDLCYITLRQSAAGYVYQDGSGSRTSWQRGLMKLRASAALTADILVCLMGDNSLETPLTGRAGINGTVILHTFLGAAYIDATAGGGYDYPQVSGGADFPDCLVAVDAKDVQFFYLFALSATPGFKSFWQQEVIVKVDTSPVPVLATITNVKTIVKSRVGSAVAGANTYQSVRMLDPLDGDGISANGLDRTSYALAAEALQQTRTVNHGSVNPFDLTPWTIATLARCYYGYGIGTTIEDHGVSWNGVAFDEVTVEVSYSL